MHRAPLAWVCAVSFLLVVSGARAQDSELVEACFKAVNAESDDITCQLCQKAVDGTQGANRTVALINLGRCEEGRGKLVAALARYREARSAMSADDARVQAVDKRIAAIEPRIGALRFDRSQLGGGAEVTVDGTALPAGVEVLPADPGEHEIVVATPGHEEHVQSISVADGQSVTVRLMAGVAIAVPSEGLHPQQLAAIVVGAVGVLGLVAFGVTGGLAIDRHSTLDERCPEAGGVRRCADEQGLEAAAEGEALNIINAVSLGVGAAGVAVGLVLFLTTPEDTEAARVQLELTPQSMMLRGTF